MFAFGASVWLNVCMTEYEYRASIPFHGGEPTPENGFGDYPEYRTIQGMAYFPSDKDAIAKWEKKFRKLGGVLLRVERIGWEGDNITSTTVYDLHTLEKETA